MGLETRTGATGAACRRGAEPGRGMRVALAACGLALLTAPTAFAQAVPAASPTAAPTNDASAPGPTPAVKASAAKPAAKTTAASKAAKEKAAARAAAKAAEAQARAEAEGRLKLAQRRVAAGVVLDEVAPEQKVSEAVVDVAAWVVASGDSRGLPFAVLDKGAAQLLVFSPEGKLKGLAPALIGSAPGDDSAPGVGDRELKDIPMKDRTTPAGRFLAAYGPAEGGQDVLWVDYETAVSIHAMSDSNKKEQRAKRLASASPKDNRITHGCINVSPAFYEAVVRATFADGGVFYVLPEQQEMSTAFPGFLPPQRIASAGDGNGTGPAVLVNVDLAAQR